MCDLSSVPPPNQQPVVSGGLPASPPADIVKKAARARHERWRSEQEVIAEAPTWDEESAEYRDLVMGDMGAVLAAVWPDLVALVAARDTDETTLRTHIAEEVREQASHSDECEVCYGMRRAARIAEGAGS